MSGQNSAPRSAYDEDADTIMELVKQRQSGGLSAEQDAELDRLAARYPLTYRAATTPAVRRFTRRWWLLAATRLLLLGGIAGYLLFVMVGLALVILPHRHAIADASLPILLIAVRGAVTVVALLALVAGFGLLIEAGFWLRSGRPIRLEASLSDEPDGDDRYSLFQRRS